MQKEARPEWSEVPSEIIKQIEKVIEGEIIKSEIAWGGYSNTACFNIETKDHKKFFIKGSHPNQDAHGTKMVDQEIYAYKNIPNIENIAPKFLGQVNDGDEDGWSLMIFEYVEVQKSLIWRGDLIVEAFHTLKKIHEIDEIKLDKIFPHARTTNYIERYFKEEGGWLRIAEEEKIYKKLIAIFEDEKAADEYFKKALPLFCEQQKQFTKIKTREGVIHQDLRVDNFIFDKNSKAYLIDFPNVCYGPLEMDLAMLLPSIAEEAQIGIGELLSLYIKTTGINIQKEDYIKALTCFAGFLADSVYRAVPEKLPRLRVMQKQLFSQTLVYLSSELGIGVTPKLKI